MIVLLDAGPALNFLAVGRQGLLIDLAKSANSELAVPEQVSTEVIGMAKSPRFARTPVGSTWGKLTAAKRISVLSDDLTDDEFAGAVSRVGGVPASERTRTLRSLGEIMVIAHASVRTQQGQDVFVLMDDGDGRSRALREQAWLARRETPGTFNLWGTRQVLKHTAPDNWETIYDAMRAFDDGLPPRP